MTTSKWIWYPGDFEIAHSIKLHSRREEFGCEYPSMWGLANVYPRVNFRKTAVFQTDGWVKIRRKGKAYLTVDGRKYPMDQRVEIPAGEHRFSVVAIRGDGLPAIYCESDQLASDESWLCTPGTPTNAVPAACEPAFTSPDDDVDVFPFTYTPIAPVSVDGSLHDFGRELFAVLEFDADPADTITVVYGESVEEATTFGLPNERDNALIYETVSGKAHYR
ncbi:MAG: hypothetical protein E7632_09010, partial [Ruminococcaceae bacterium]|nr:hypothetical protein [Oscillospiraceae bacterium]